MRTLDYAVLITYLIAVVAFGCGFVLRSRSSERFMAAGRSLPGWAVGLSIFGSYVSSISFLANPMEAYASNWGAFVFAFSLPLAAWLSVRYFVPFYRKSGEVSAYQHLENRFGSWARTYAVVCYLLLQATRLGMILFLLATALQPIMGGKIQHIIIVAGIVVTIYPLLGGTEAVIWTGVVQSLVMTAGPVVCVVLLLVGMPEGPGQVIEIADQEDKFSLGSFDFDFVASTFWVILVYGLVTHLQNFGIDQTYVQRYLTAQSDREAARSVWVGALCFIPLSALFFLIGTALFAFYRVHPGLLPAGAEPKQVFPFFIAHQLPPGVTGLMLAAICSAAMDSNLNCCATLVLCDIYRRYFRPAATERESMWVLRATTLVMGGLCTGVALAMIEIESALQTWWLLAGICSGGVLGLFLLGLMFRRAHSAGAAIGTVAGVLVIAWMIFSPGWSGTMEALRSPFDKKMILVIGTLTILMVGLLSSWLLPRSSNPRFASAPEEVSHEV